MKKAVMYVRLSQSEKREHDDPARKDRAQVSSLQDQANSCIELARREGYEIVERFDDDGVSAWSGKVRPGFIDLIERVREGDVDAILAVEDSRLTRDVGANQYLQAVCIETDTYWHTVAGGLTNPNTPDGRMFATIKAAIDEYESEVKAFRVQRSVQRRLAATKDIGGPRPFGWEKDRVTVREDEAALLRRAFDELNAGMSVYQITKEVFEASDIRPPRARNSAWRTQSVRNILLQPRHYGRLVVKGIDYGSFGEGVVSEEVWRTAHAILTNPARDSRRGAKDRYFTGVARCGRCGSRMGAADSRNTRCRREGDRNAQGKHASIKQSILEEAMLRSVESAFIHGRLEDMGSAGGVAEANFILSEESRIAEALRQTIEDRNNGVPGSVANPEIRRLTKQLEELKSKRDALQAKSAAAEVLLHAASRVFKGRKVSLNDAVEEARSIRRAFLSLSVERQRELLEALMDVTVLTGRRGIERVEIVNKFASGLESGEEEYIPSEDDIAEVERRHAKYALEAL